MFVNNIVIKVRLCLLILLLFVVKQYLICDPTGKTTLTDAERQILNQAIAALSDLQKAKETINRMNVDYAKVVSSLTSQNEELKLLTNKNKILVDDNSRLNAELDNSVKMISKQNKQLEELNGKIIIQTKMIQRYVVWLLISCFLCILQTVFIIINVVVRRRRNAN